MARECLYLYPSCPANELSGACSTYVTITAVIDLINHTFDKSIECKVEYPAEGMQIRAPKSDPKAFNVTKVRTENGNTETEEQWQRGCSKGDELFITYGAHSNEVGAAWLLVTLAPLIHAR